MKQLGTVLSWITAPLWMPVFLVLWVGLSVVTALGQVIEKLSDGGSQ